MCRKSYVHPAVIETYLDERRLELPRAKSGELNAGLDSDEKRVLRFLTELGDRDEGRERLARLERSVAAAKAKARRRKVGA